MLSEGIPLAWGTALLVALAHPDKTKAATHAAAAARHDLAALSGTRLMVPQIFSRDVRCSVDVTDWATGRYGAKGAAKFPEFLNS